MILFLKIGARLCAGACVAAFAAGCVTTEKKGDVTLYHSNGVSFAGPAMPGYGLVFPAVDLGRAGEQVIRVRDLPTPIFPEFGDIDVPKKEDDNYAADQPWRRVRLVITYRTPEGKVFYKRRVDLRDWNGGSSPGKGSSRRSIGVRVSPWDGLESDAHPLLFLNYDLVVDVVRPSLRATDRMTLDAFTPEMRAARN